jgi:D-3-phosphoglycerate dehydrogenase
VAERERPTVLLVDPIDEQAERLLGDHAVVRHAADRSPDGLRRAIAGADAAIVRTTRIDAGVIAAAPRLRVIAKHGTGVDSIDVAAASGRGVVVTYGAGVNATAVAEFALCAILLALKPILAASAWLRDGPVEAPMVVAAQRAGHVGRDVAEQTVGVVGWGDIGRKVGAFAAGLGARVLVFDPLVSSVGDEAELVDDLHTFLARCDVVSVHVPLADGTRHLLSTAEFAAMPDAAALVNTARGGVVDEAALAQALASGRLRLAFVDVFETEPPPVGHPLLGQERAICTPHIAGSTVGSLRAMGMDAAESVLAVLAGRRPPRRANPRVWRGNGHRPIDVRPK